MSKWSKIDEREVRIVRKAIDTKMFVPVIGNEEGASFVAYPDIAIEIDGVNVIYTPARQQKTVL